MAGKRAEGLLLFCFLWSFQPWMAGCLEQEAELLLSFKAAVEDPLWRLSDWVRGDSPAASLCRWHGISCDPGESHVLGLELPGENISGRIPASSIFRLPFIQTVNLAYNHLHGDIPGDVFSCSSLRHLNLSSNNFTGSLRAAVNRGSLPHLQTLDLSSNNLSGEILPEIGSLRVLRELDIGGNAFTGEIPESLTNLTGLEFLTLSSNQLAGGIPPGISRMKGLKWIYFGYNQLSGEIPGELGDLSSLYSLDLVYNNLAGEIPPSLGKLENLEYLFLYMNKLSGPVPRSVFGLGKLVSLDLSGNSLSGDIPESMNQLQNLEVLQLFSNNFTGKIPAGLASLPRLRLLQLWSNRFTGEIPKNLGKQSNLTVLDLSTNGLSGKIPETLCKSGRLFKLILFSNLLEGEIPRSFSSCRSLKRVRLQNNRLSGGIPPEFTTLPLVYFLDISGNNLSGEIAGRKWDMPELQMINFASNGFTGVLPESFGSGKLESINLSENRFEGRIPSSFGSFSELLRLDLAGNNLSGEIPAALSSCKKLFTLSLQRNQLTGIIPESLCKSQSLSELDLSENLLSGEIPPNLGEEESLVLINISHNHLHGRLPSTGAFLAINASAVSGNELCGGDSPRRALPPCRRTHKNRTAKFVLLTILSLILAAIGVSSYSVVLVRRRRNLDSERIKKVTMEDGTCWELRFFDSDISEAITIDDVVTGTREEGVGISAGTGMRYMLQEVRDAGVLSGNSMEGFGKLRHRNVVRLIGTYFSKKTGFLIHEFVEGKTLPEALAGLTAWEQRRTIAYGLASALKFLHSRRPPAISVGGLSPEKVIVDGHGESRLRVDFPAAAVGCSERKNAASSAACVAPETGEAAAGGGGDRGDVYGFGVVLIGLLTGKFPAAAGPQRSVGEWANAGFRNRRVDSWIDPTIRAGGLHEENEMMGMMDLALQCMAGEPACRPSAGDVLRALDSGRKDRSAGVPGCANII